MSMSNVGLFPYEKNFINFCVSCGCALRSRSGSDNGRRATTYVMDQEFEPSLLGSI